MQMAHPSDPPSWPPLPPAKLLDMIGSSCEDFASNGLHFLEIFRRHGGLQPTHRVLDVGCGCGRMALPLTGYLNTGSYEGFDVVPELVAWCRENIASRHSNFRFTHVDAASYRDRGQGILPTPQLRFPYADDSFDFTFLTSVFTHMFPSALAHYAGEIARTLKPGGTALLTFFILNEESRRLERTPENPVRFRYPYWKDGVRFRSLSRPTHSVAYPEESAREILLRNGLEVRQALYGNWCGRQDTVSFQDIFIVRKVPVETPTAAWVLVEARLGQIGRPRSFTLLARRASPSERIVEIPVLTPGHGQIHQVAQIPADADGLELRLPADVQCDTSSVKIRRVGWIERTVHMAYRTAKSCFRLPGEVRVAAGLTFGRMLTDLDSAYQLALRFDTLVPWLEYSGWGVTFDTPLDLDISQIRAHIGRFTCRPRFHLLLTGSGGRAESVNATLASLQRQLYLDFTCFVLDEAATPVVTAAQLEGVGTESRIVAQSALDDWLAAFNTSLAGRRAQEWVMLLHAGDRLPAHALYQFACAINDRPDAEIVYSDDDAVDAAGARRDPRFKPDWSPAHLRSTHYIGAAAALRGGAVSAAGGVSRDCCRHGNYGLLLRIGDASAKAPTHVPAILYHRDGTRDAGLSAWEDPRWCTDVLQAHFAHTGSQALVEATLPGCRRVRYLLPETAPLVSIIVPTRDAVNLLRQCVESVLGKTAYPRFEVLVVDNQSTDPATLAYLAQVANHSLVRVLRYDQPFNFSAITNFAAGEARGEALCLLNNDTEVISPDWLDEMAGHLAQPGVGAVGARLLYPDGTVQHAGVTVGPGGGADHLHAHSQRGDPGYCNRAMVAQELSAVTAACLLTWKHLHQRLGGFNENDLPVAFNDVDFCLRLQEAGYRVIYTPHAELFHYESATRGREDSWSKRRRAARELRYLRRRWAARLRHDPYYNPNLSYGQPDFSHSPAPRMPKPWR